MTDCAVIGSGGVCSWSLMVGNRRIYMRPKFLLTGKARECRGRKYFKLFSAVGCAVVLKTVLDKQLFFSLVGLFVVAGSAPHRSFQASFAVLVKRYG